MAKIKRSGGAADKSLALLGKNALLLIRNEAKRESKVFLDLAVVCDIQRRCCGQILSGFISYNLSENWEMLRTGYMF